jgi:hypothetical protein
MFFQPIFIYLISLNIILSIAQKIYSSLILYLNILLDQYTFVHIYFLLKRNLLFYHPSSSLQVSTAYGHDQLLSILLKLLHLYQSYILHVKAVLPN